jgi:hypothetical protein
MAASACFRVVFVAFTVMLAVYMFAQNNTLDAVRERFTDLAGGTPPGDFDIAIATNVSDVYSIALNRLPSPTELRRYHDLVANGGLTYDRLRVILESSSERSRMLRMQTNAFPSDMLPRITERQLELAIAQVYREVFGRVFDESEREFLLSKFQEFDNDQNVMRRFLETMRDFRMRSPAGRSPSAHGGDTGSHGGDTGSHTGDTGAHGRDNGAHGGDTGSHGGDNGAHGGDTGSHGGDTGSPGADTGADTSQDTFTDPPNIYSRCTDSEDRSFFTNPSDNAANFVNRRNKETLNFVCRKAQSSDKTWGMLMPDTEWSFRMGQNDTFERSWRARNTDAHPPASALYYDTALNGTLLSNETHGTQEPIRSGTLLTPDIYKIGS